MNLTEFYREVGGNYEEVLGRLPSADMVNRFVHKFVNDPSYSDLKKALADADFQTAFRAAHSLKGTAATLGLDALASAASELTEALRHAAEMPPSNLVENLDIAYVITIEKIGLISM